MRFLILFLSLFVLSATAQTVSPRQLLPATAARVSRPDLKYKLQSDPLNGGKFWYVVDTPSVATGGGVDVVPSWQQVTDVGKTTTHFVTASGLTLTQLTTGNEVDSIIVVKNGVLKRYPRTTPIVHTANHITYSEITPTKSLTENPVQVGSNVGAIQIQNIQFYTFQERWRDIRQAGFREVMKDSQAFKLPVAPTDKMTIDVLIQSNIRKLQFVGTAAHPIDTLTQSLFFNARHGSVFRCQLSNHSVDGPRWFIWQVSNPAKRIDTVNVSPNRVVELNEIQSHVLMSSRFGTWQSGNGVTFQLPRFPSEGQEIVITNQIGVIQGNTEFRFAATGGYTFKFPNGTQKVFAYDPLSINSTAHTVFTYQECQFRCIANTIDKKWSCFVTAQ